jgi:hypothetical protein
MIYDNFKVAVEEAAGKEPEMNPGAQGLHLLSRTPGRFDFLRG